MRRALRTILLAAVPLVPSLASADPGAACRETSRLLSHEWKEDGSPVPESIAAPLWDAAARCAAEWLGAHPGAPADELANALEALGGDLSASAARLAPPPREAVALALGRACAGTVVVLESGRLAWTIKDVARAHYESRDEVGWWAHETPGYHDGPLVGRVLALPPARGGSPRFLVDAIAHSMMGLAVPAQLSVWEWRGGLAEPVFIHRYGSHYETHEVKADGDLLRVTTREEPRTFFTCGSCEEPRGIWTLRVTDDGVEDLGTSWEAPELAFLDEILAGAACGGAEALAAPEVRDVLAGAIAAAAPEGAETAAVGAGCPSLGVLLGWHVEERGGARLLVAELEELGTVTLELAGERDRPWAVRVDVGEADGCPEGQR